MQGPTNDHNPAHALEGPGTGAVVACHSAGLPAGHMAGQVGGGPPLARQHLLCRAGR